MDKIKEKLHLSKSHTHDGSSDQSSLTPAQQIVEETRNSDDTPDALPLHPATDTRPRTGSVATDSKPNRRVSIAPGSPTDAVREAGPKPSDVDSKSVAPSVSTTIRSETKRMHKFLDHFEDQLDDGEELISYYTAALQSKILIQGHFYVSQKHVAFSSDLIGAKRRIMHSFADITAIHKSMTLKVIPNAIVIESSDGKLELTSFLSRDAVHELLMSLWKDLNLEAYNAFVSSSATEEDEKDMSSLEEVPKGRHPATKSDSPPLAEVALDVRLPTTPEKAYGLIWRNPDFLRPFMENAEKLTNVKLGDWEGEPPKRHYSYIKPLNNSVGPKETECTLIDEEKFADPEKYYEHMTITKTPHVPSGDSFEIHTQTVISWAGGGKGGCKVFVTTELKWSGRSMLKGVITKASIDGQKEYHKDLIREVRKHIKAHADEFADGDTGDITADDELEHEEEANHGSSGGSMLDSLIEDPVKLAMLAIIVILILIDVYIAFKPSSGTKSTRSHTPLDAAQSQRLENLEAIIDKIRLALTT